MSFISPARGKFTRAHRCTHARTHTLVPSPASRLPASPAPKVGQRTGCKHVDTSKRAVCLIHYHRSSPFDERRQSHLSSLSVYASLCAPVYVFWLNFFICFSLSKTQANRPDAVSIATFSLQAADAGKGFLQFNPPGNLPSRGCWYKMLLRDA